MDADPKNSKVNAGNAAAADSADDATGESQRAQTAAGNFLRNDHSLVMRSARSDRFTEKFKDGIVHRILNGTTTIADVRKQHHLTEQDVIDWMKQSFDRKQKRVDELTHQLRLTDSPNEERIIKIESQPRRVTIDGDVIDGRSQSKQH